MVLLEHGVLRTDEFNKSKAHWFSHVPHSIGNDEEPQVCLASCLLALSSEHSLHPLSV